MNELAVCAHLMVVGRDNNKGGLVTRNWWECRDCKTEFAPKSPELICSVCEQRIEHIQGGEYMHGAETDEDLTVRLGCICKAVPKAPEPTGDHKVTPKEEFEYERETDGRWIVENITVPGELAYGATKEEALENLLHIREPKAPDVIEVELPPLEPLKYWIDTTDYFRRQKEQRERQLKAEIADRQMQWKIMDKAVRYEYARAEKAEKERDTALEQLNRLPANWFEDSSLETWFPITDEEIRRLKAERDAALAEVERFKQGAAYSEDAEAQLAEALGVPPCPTHNKYCAPHVAAWLVENKKRTDQLQRDLDAAKEVLGEFANSPILFPYAQERIRNLLK